MVVCSSGEQKIYDHPEVLHKLLEANPLLEAFDGFKQASRRRLNDQDVSERRG